MVETGSVIELTVEKAAAGGRMLGRHHGQVVLVWGAIPGERVEARVERTGKGVAYADTTRVLSASPDRRPATSDWRCGGNVFAHVCYERQLLLKGDIVQDAFARIGRVPLSARPGVVGSPEQGYRMRARLHVHEGRLGFYREGTHQLCDAAATGQLLPATHVWIAAAEETLLRERLTGLAGVELAENISGNERACHLELHAGADPAPFAALAKSLVGLSAQRGDRSDVVRLTGTPVITDHLQVREGDGAMVLRLRRNVRAFFQSNRFLLERLVQHVVALVPKGPVVDLYAGVGLFGLSVAASGAGAITLVEGDPVSSADLAVNAQPFRDRVRIERRSVEAFLASAADPSPHATFIVDPPRTGLSTDALNGLARKRPERIVYVSCDVATLARDGRALIDAGYEFGGLSGFDLFPNTAHVETVALFAR